MLRTMSKRGIVQSFLSFIRRKPISSQASSRSCQFSLLSESKSSLPKSLLYSAICVERLPVITNAKSNTEEKFSGLLAKLEFEHSLLSDHELRLQKEAKVQKKKGDDYDEEEVEGENETALDLEDKWEVELKQFVPADRVTEADRANNHHTVNRQLDSTLYLLVKQNIEGHDHWVLPQATWENGESLRQTAERALSSVCGDVKVTFLGNAPCAVAKYNPPNEDMERGIKLFFFKAWYEDGAVMPNKSFANDHVWVTKKELSDYCHPGYRKNLKKFLD